jgi:hypothetical protein
MQLRHHVQNGTLCFEDLLTAIRSANILLFYIKTSVTLGFRFQLLPTAELF